MPITSAGLLMYRIRDGRQEVFLVHPGGPYYKNKDYWGIPKGEIDEGEDIFAAAQREFAEETGFPVKGPFKPLGTVEKPDKIVHAWAFEGDNDPAAMISNTCEIEWPPRSGKKLAIPEVDRGAYFRLEEAKAKISTWQEPLIDRFEEMMGQPL